MGRKTTVTQSMINSVTWLDEAFQTVRLDRGSIELGRMKGNIDRPTVEMMPMTASDEPPKAAHPRRNLRPVRAIQGPTKPRTGAIHIQGWAAKLASHPPAMAMLCVAGGLEGPARSAAPSMRKPIWPSRTKT